jgi:riboflavin synthase
VFTGIVEGVGIVEAVQPHGERVRLVLAPPAELLGGVEVGDSIAVNGACLTVTSLEAGRVAFDAVRETLAKTSLGDLRSGARVNLERALRAGERLDGHIVQGHVDTAGHVRSLERRGDDVVLRVDCDPDFADLLVDKGSVAVDGVSLTVVDAGPSDFSVALIPHTLAATTLGERGPGDRVNLEADVLGKYVKRYVERILSRSADASPA